MRILKQILKKPFVYAVIFSILLTSFSTYVLLDTFVIAHSVTKVTAADEADNSGNASDGSDNSGSSTDSTSSKAAVATETSYEDENIKITLQTEVVDDTTVYIAEVQLSSAEYLQTALAQVMQSYGCETAYNLDGGGSSTLYFNGQVINNPTTNGKSFGERKVSDIVYIGY